MTPLPRGEAVLRRASENRLRLGTRDVRIRTPSIVDFVLMKLDATTIRRPRSPKDAFDLYAYVRRKAPLVVGRALGGAPERDEALHRLRELFGSDDAAGVADVLAFAPTLDGNDSSPRRQGRGPFVRRSSGRGRWLNGRSLHASERPAPPEEHGVRRVLLAEVLW